MAKKRLASEEGDFEDSKPQTTSAAKRMRTNTNGNNKAEERDVSESPSERLDDDNASVTEDVNVEKKFEERYAEVVREAIENRSRTAGVC